MCWLCFSGTSSKHILQDVSIFEIITSQFIINLESHKNVYSHFETNHASNMNYFTLGEG